MSLAELREWKCKTCGEPLSLERAKDGVIECEFCASRFTLPKLTADQKVVSFLLQGEHDLDTGKFEDAYTAFFKASELDKTEPEAYFGMALAEFKVQYIKDEVNNRLQPICHEVTDKDFCDGANFLKALRYATEAQRAEYERKGEEINYIKDEFFKIAESGVKYDCFICVKVTDEHGGRTEDYKIADDIYFELKGKGYKPFFSERELGGVTGADYEARILYALKSAECMLVICLDEAYLRTKWVKNEYTRFLKLVNDEEKESDSIALVFGKKPIEKLAGKRGKIQGIDINTLTAIERIVAFVDAHTPEARKRREEQARRKNEEAEALKKKLAEQEEILKKQAEMFEQMQKQLLSQTAVAQAAHAPTPVPATDSFAKKLTCRSCGAPLNVSKAKNGVIECDYCFTSFVLPDLTADLSAERERKAKEEAERKAREKAEAEERARLERERKAREEAERKAREERERQEKLARDFEITDGVLIKYRGRDTKVVIPDGVTIIGESAFRDCGGLTSIVIPNGVTSIEKRAFSECSELTSIVIPNSVTSIGMFAFNGCDRLTSIIIPNGVRDICSGTFNCCFSLTSITIPSSVTNIDGSAFYSCSGLKSLIIPNGVTSVGESAFKFCSSLTSIVIPNSVASIGSYAFEHCDKLQTIYCRADKKPNGWDKDWNKKEIGLFGGRHNVVWGYKG